MRAKQIFGEGDLGLESAFCNKAKSRFLFTAKNFFSIFIITMDHIDRINFKATPLNKVKIKKYDANLKKFVSTNGMFILLDGKNKGDLDAMNYVSKKWKKADYVKEITTAAKWMGNNEYIKVYAVTEQKKNFDKLSPRKILGLAEMREEQDDGNILSHIQVKPSAKNINSDKKNYKRVGKSIIKSLQKIYNQISLTSVNNKNVEEFYRDNNFIEYLDSPGNFVWYKNIFIRFKLKIQNILNKAGLL